MANKRVVFCLVFAAHLMFAATDVRVEFTANTKDLTGAAIQQKRIYFLYRPDNLPKSTPAPVVLIMSGSPSLFHRKADEAGFVVVGTSFSGNATSGKGWDAGDPESVGWDDYDYITQVIQRVKASENCNDAFTIGLSKGGHMSLAYACERASTIRAAGSLDEFMGVTTNIPKAPLPIIMFHGTADNAVPYTMVKHTADVWRALDKLLGVTPVTTYEASPLIPGRVSQATWRGGVGGAQVAFVTIIGGTHTYPTPAIETGYDFTDGMWAFFSQFLTSSAGAPQIVSQPASNSAIAGQPASFHVTATGSAPLSYQWQRNGVDIPGANSGWLTVAGDRDATFAVVVRNKAGSVTSATAALTVKAPPPGPAITTQPSDRQVVAGQSVSFTVAAAGVGTLHYQWKKNGANISGATGASLAIPAAITADCGASFTVVVTDETGSVNSNRATLTVTAAAGAPVILEDPERARLSPGQTASYTVKARSKPAMKYQWQKGTFGGNMEDIPGATQATYTTAPVTLADSRTLFRCVVSNAAGSVTSATEMLLVTPARPVQ